MGGGGGGVNSPMVKVSRKAAFFRRASLKCTVGCSVTSGLIIGSDMFGGKYTALPLIGPEVSIHWDVLYSVTLTVLGTIIRKT